MEKYKKSSVMLAVLSMLCNIGWIMFILNAGAWVKETGRDPETNPVMDLIMSWICCFLWAFKIFPKYAKALDEARTQAGLPALNLGVLHAIISPWGIYAWQEGLNELIDRGGK